MTQLLIEKFRLTLKKIGKTSRPFKYDLNQIPYNYTVEVTNTFKRSDLIQRIELWMEVRDNVHETGIKAIPKKNKCKKAKWLSEEAVQIAEKRKDKEHKEGKERYTHFECKVPKNSKEG